MEKIKAHLKKRKMVPFNSSLETGVRSVIILNASYPNSYDLAQLTWLDHIIVHSEDLNGPPSLHPDIPQRSGEILIRRKLVESGLILMRQLHMVDVNPQKQGILYSASDEAQPFVNLMNSNYASLLKERAQWLANDIGKLSHVEMRTLIINRLGKWNIEFDKKPEEKDSKWIM